MVFPGFGLARIVWATESDPCNLLRDPKVRMMLGGALETKLLTIPLRTQAERPRVKQPSWRSATFFVLLGTIPVKDLAQTVSSVLDFPTMEGLHGRMEGTFQVDRVKEPEVIQAWLTAKEIRFFIMSL